MATLSIIVPSSGRPTLGATLGSIYPQMRPGDEMLLDVNADGDWGHQAINRQILKAKGDAVMVIDDDDVYLPGALDAARSVVEQQMDRLHLFCMRYADSGVVLGADRVFACGFVGTPMIVAPRRLIIENSPGAVGWSPRLLAWFGPTYEGDWQYAEQAAAVLGDPVWHPETVALIRPHEAPR